MRCQRCGAEPVTGAGYCRVCGTPLTSDFRPPPRLRPSSSVRSRRLSAVVLAAMIFLLLICLLLTVAGYGLTSLIQWR